jgi:uncharacterized protein (TIGR00730 family)
MSERSMKSIAIFCGSSPGNDPAFVQAADDCGRAIAAAGLSLVYGGGRVGMMGRVADAALAAGGKVIGVIPRHLVTREVDHRGLSALHVVETMHERKAMMAELADAFVALPGGLGTLEEIAEIFVWRQLGLHDKPCALLNVAGYYDHLQAFFRQAVDSRFLRAEQMAQLRVVDQVAELLPALRNAPRGRFDKWQDRAPITR